MVRNFLYFRMMYLKLIKKLLKLVEYALNSMRADKDALREIA